MVGCVVQKTLRWRSQPFLPFNTVVAAAAIPLCWYLFCMQFHENRIKV